MNDGMWNYKIVGRLHNRDESLLAKASLNIS